MFTFHMACRVVWDLSDCVMDSQAVKMTSTKHPLPYEYYYLPFCRPDKVPFPTSHPLLVLLVECRLIEDDLACFCVAAGAPT